MNYNQAIEYLFNLTRLGWRLGVDKILSLLNELDNPHEKYKVVHVAGTNGKGSTSSMLASILNAAGYNSGLFTSPHLVYVGERIKYNNIPINREELVDYISRLQPLIKKYNCTFFEALTAIAMVYFADKKVDIAVIEVGLGGRLDATNVVRPVISIITNIDIDHVKQLGRTRRSIASEKAGIIKPDSICISNTKHKSAGDVFDQICKKVNVDHIQLSQLMKIDNVRLDENFTTLDLSVNGAFFPRLKIALIGEHQIENAATAVAAATVLNSKFMPVNTQDIYNGLQNVIWPGRLQLLRSQPKIVADVAHNLNGFTVLKKAVRNIFKYDRLIMVAGFAKDKDYHAMIRKISSLVDILVAVRADNSRSLSATVLAKAARQYIPEVKQFPRVVNGLDFAINHAQKNDLILCTGSHFVIGEIFQILNGGDYQKI